MVVFCLNKKLSFTAISNSIKKDLNDYKMLSLISIPLTVISNNMKKHLNDYMSTSFTIDLLRVT